MIVSQTDAPVDFNKMLSCRVANIVPIDDVEIALRSVSASTQTIGIYPEELKRRVRDRLAFQGAQRIVSLGAATMMDIARTPGRSEERRVGTECVKTCRSRGSQEH